MKVQFEGVETIFAREVTRGSETFIFRDKDGTRSGSGSRKLSLFLRAPSPYGHIRVPAMHVLVEVTATRLA